MHALYQLSDALRALSKISLGGQEAPSRRNSEIDITNTIGVSVQDRNPLNSEAAEHFDIQLDLAAPHLVRAAEISIGEAEVQLNIIRTLCVLSEQELCCNAIAKMAARIGILLGPGHVPSMPTDGPATKATMIEEKSLGVLSRIGYILGNIMARSDLARVQFYNNDVAMEYLLQHLEAYTTNRLTLKIRLPTVGERGSSACESDTAIDVVIKLIRVVANMSVNPDVGHGLACCHPLGSILLSLLLTINKFKSNFVRVKTSISWWRNFRL